MSRKNMTKADVALEEALIDLFANTEEGQQVRPLWATWAVSNDIMVRVRRIVYAHQNGGELG